MLTCQKDQKTSNLHLGTVPNYCFCAPLPNCPRLFGGRLFLASSKLLRKTVLLPPKEETSDFSKLHLSPKLPKLHVRKIVIWPHICATNYYVPQPGAFVDEVLDVFDFVSAAVGKAKTCIMPYV